MKIAELNYNPKKYKGLSKKGEWNHHVILETVDDVNIYMEIEKEIEAKDAWRYWCDAKKYDAAHAVMGRRGGSVAMHSRIITNEIEGKETTMVDAFEEVDKVLTGKYLNMVKFLNSGYKVRVGSKGGYSMLDDSFVTRNEIDIDEHGLREYLLTEKYTPQFSIKEYRGQKCVVIENDKYVTEGVLGMLDKFKFRYCYYAVRNFNDRTKNTPSNIIYNEFQKLLDQGMKAIMAETTGYFSDQLDNMTHLIKKLMHNNPDKKLDVYLLTNVKIDKKDMPKNITLKRV